MGILVTDSAERLCLIIFLRTTLQEIQSDDRIDSAPIRFYLISIKPMKAYWHWHQGTTFKSLVLESECRNWPEPNVTL